MSDKEKRSPGRPRKETTDVAFVLDPIQADYLLEMGKRLGWGDSIHAVAKKLVETKVTEFQEASFKAAPWPLPRKDD